MVDRINLILKAKNLTSRQFAEEIGIQPSGMSHILSGRNRPSLDFVMKVVSRYPEIDIKWLTMGEGQMYNTSVYSPTVPTSSTQTNVVNNPPVQPDLFSMMETENGERRESERDHKGANGFSAENGERRTENGERKTDLEPELGLEPEPEPEPEPDLEPDNRRCGIPATQVSEPEPDLNPVISQIKSPAPVVTEEAGKPIMRETILQGQQEVVAPKSKAKRIVKLVILYDDHTFAEYFPE